MEQVRSFVAIDLPEGLKLELAGLRERLMAESRSSVKWVDPAGIHLTLKFLGDVVEEKLDDITKVLAEAVTGISPFQLTVGGLGVFPNSRKARVAWVGLSGEIDRLQHMQKRVESSLEPLGFKTELRGFTPHLTLARVRDGVSPGDRQRFGEMIGRSSFKAGNPILVERVHLVRSQLTGRGAIYSKISSFSLG